MAKTVAGSAGSVAPTSDRVDAAERAALPGQQLQERSRRLARASSSGPGRAQQRGGELAELHRPVSDGEVHQPDTWAFLQVSATTGHLRVAGRLEHRRAGASGRGPRAE